MWHRLWKPWGIVLPWTAIVLLVLYIAYRFVDPLPPRHLAIAAGIPGTGYDVFARQYARILARDGVDLEVHNYDSAIHHFDVLRDATSPVQAALTTFGFTKTGSHRSSNTQLWQQGDARIVERRAHAGLCPPGGFS